MSDHRPKNPEMEPVFDLDKETFRVLHQIVQDMKEDADRTKIKNWGVPVKSLKNCSIKTHSNGTASLVVFELHGGLRVRQEPEENLRKRSMETVKLLKLFEKELKKRFKDKTGKALKLTQEQTSCHHELVATNGLYRFWAYKHCYIKTELDGQEYKESLKGDS
jgi:hypothetical protein